MRFATNCAKAYLRASAPTRRRFNQAVVEKTMSYSDPAELREPLQVILERQ